MSDSGYSSPGRPGLLIERVMTAGNFALLRSCAEKSADAARALARADLGSPADRPDAELRKKLRALERVHVTGLRGSSFAFVAEALRHRLQKPILLVCPDGETAADTFSDFRTISTGTAALFPERDIFPHRHEGENLAVRGDRNDCLLQISTGRANIVVTSLLGFLEKTIPVEAMRASRLAIHRQGSVDLEELRQRLFELGYDAVSVVEEVGQFAVRGSIVDIFDPSWDAPARFELWDDQVASIRTFNIDSQRSIENIESVTILPASSVPFEDEAIDNLRGYLQERDFTGTQIDVIEEEIRHSRHSFLWHRYAPALGMDGSMIDYFPQQPVVLFSDVAACNRMMERHREEIAHFAARPDEEYPLLRLEDYLNPPDYYRRHGVATVWRWEITTGAAASDETQHDDEKGKLENTYEPPRSDERTIKFTTAAHPSVVGKIDPLIGVIRKHRQKSIETYIYAETPTQRERLADILEDAEELVHLPVGWITSGFIWPAATVAVLTDHQIFKRILPRPRRRQPARRVQGMRHEHLQLGDFIVHIDYGIGRFVGLDKVGTANAEAECLVIRFHGGDKIYVPLDQMQLVEKYVGKEGITPQLDRLGGTRWQKTKEKARRAVEDIAHDLLKVYAEREVARGHAFKPDTQWQKELEASFPYEETPHQLSATEDIKADMEAATAMDRLVCGDVGFGKTEVAIRAAFKAAVEGKQVAILVPTTLLAYQHFNTFKERTAQFPIRVEMLSRFVSPADQKRVLEGLANGTVDIVVGTHRLLSKDIRFRDVGLLIIDEEHRFGVKHKERLKQLSKTVDVLSLTATPIPRTLYMSLSGLRKISVIDTPPRNRHPIKTEVSAFEEETIIRAISEEVGRDGQVFFVHNRVRSIASMQSFLERMLPGIRFVVAHGQMAEKQLEKVMLDFVQRKYDVLISTMIIESGLDFPNVNTIIINRADRFGLAQLYQLRGRVGRREQQAFAYFLVPRQLQLSATASKRLEAMEEFEELGSGYRLAMRDLEIRGAGNVLGVAQHGHVAAVGFEMYCKMLKEAVDALTAGGEVAPLPQCRVESPYECFIPGEYIDDPDERMIIYKRLATCSTSEDVDSIAEELVDRFGPAPISVGHLLDLTRVKLLAARFGVAVVHIREPGYKPPVSEAFEQAARVPRSDAPIPRNVPRAAHGSSRLRRIAEMASRGELGAKADGAGEVTLEFGPDKAPTKEQCGRLVETFGGRLLFKSGKIFALNLKADPVTPQLQDLKNLLRVAAY